jgi:hypothetical protein
MTTGRIGPNTAAALLDHMQSVLARAGPIAARPPPPVPQPQDVRCRKMAGIRSENLSIEHLPHAVILCAVDDAGLLQLDPRSTGPASSPGGGRRRNRPTPIVPRRSRS